MRPQLNLIPLAPLVSLCVAYNVDVLLPDHVPSCDCIPWSKNASASSAFSNIDNVDLADSACAMPANGNFPDPEAPIYAVYDGYCLCSPGDDSATTWFSWCSPPPLAPSQINLNVVNATAINVNFVTASVSENDSVHAQLKLKGDSGPTTNIIGYSTIYKDSTADRHLHYHNVLLHSLKERTHYEYRVKITSGTWSPWIPFQSLYSSGETNVAMYADFGFFSSQTKTESYDYPSPSRSHIGVILDDVANGLVDFALHSGDHAYEFEVGGGARGDAYMDLYQPFLQSTPWMAGWGNHEYLEGDYGNRLANITGGLIDAKRSVDGSVNRMFYSVDIGLLHTTIIDASPYHCNFENCMEVDSCGFPQEFIDLESGEADWLGYRAAILKWTEEDLARVDRTKTPWLFVTGHYPMYENGYVDPPEENKEADWGAKGDRWLKEEEEGEISPSADQFMADFEGLLEKYKVDVFFAGHNHNYEVTYPVFRNGTVTQKDYVNPKGVVHILSGVAGAPERQGFNESRPLPDWARKDSWTDENSYSRLKFYNRTHVRIQQISNNNGTVLDEFVIINDH